jgi:hypothetical protein
VSPRRLAGLVVLALSAGAAPAHAAVPDAIRVGGPSAPSDSKVAIVASARPLVGRAFTVRDAGGRLVLAGRLRAVRGTPAPWAHAAAADLSRVRAPGRYVVRVGGVRSRPWVVQADVREAAVRRLLRVFAVNADGTEPNPVYGPAHLNDAIVRGGPYDGQRFDLTGGWRDAGDFLKFAQTTGWAVSYLHLAAQLDPGNADALRLTAAVGERWLLKAHPRPGLFVGIVGDARDHETGFRDPAADDADTRQGVGIRYAYPTVSTEVLGEAAAGLAWAAADTTGPARDVFLAAAREWYEQARATNAKIRPTDPNLSDFYPDSYIHDDLAFAADALWRATGEARYLDEAAEQIRAGDVNELYGGIVVGAPRPLVGADLCGGLGRPAAPDPAIRELACHDVQVELADIRNLTARTAFGSPGIFTFGWIQDNGGRGVAAAAAARAGQAPDGLRIAAGARDYMLGRNPWGLSFVVGPAAVEAHDPHHSAYLKGSPRRLLDGAVVGGVATPRDLAGQDPPIRLSRTPARRYDTRRLVYEDVRSDYVTSEVGLAYSAAALLLAGSL